ncbi:MAG: tetratricopeptide repeat protein, partial [Kofleriaceae bacterium]
ARARDPKTRAELSNVLGLVAKAHGDYAAARDRFTASLQILKEAKLDGQEVAATLGNLSNVLPMLGDLAGGRKAAEEASHRDLEMFGAAHPQYADSLVELSARDSDLGDFTAATGHQLEALKIVDATYGDVSPAAMIIHNNLASSLAQDHHLAEAGVHARRALVLAEKLRGPKHPATAQALFTVANVAGERDDWPTAFDTANRALAIVTETYGPDHPMAASIVANLGEWSLRRGEAAGDAKMIRAAETYLRRALKPMLATPDSPDVAVIRTGLGSSLAAQGRHAEAIVELEAALTLRQKIGDDPVAIGDTQSTLARSLWATGKRDRAIELAHAAATAFARAGESASRYARDLAGWRAKNHVP